MSDKSTIEWTDATWNPVRGCTRVSEGCRNCYAEIMAARFSGPGMWGEGFARMVGGDHRWTGRVELVASQLDLPHRWKPRRIFVNSTSDLFHESLPERSLLRVLDIMCEANWHTYQILTKRDEHMREVLLRARPKCYVCQGTECNYCHEDGRRSWRFSPPPHIWLGVSVEDREHKTRIATLRDTPAAVRFLSLEPLLEGLGELDLSGIGWVIAGAESGREARPCDLNWIRDIRDQCAAAGVPFFFKQHVERGRKIPLPMLDGRQHAAFPA